LSNNNEMCYSIKNQTFSPTKQTHKEEMTDQARSPTVLMFVYFKIIKSSEQDHIGWLVSVCSQINNHEHNKI